MSDSDYFRDSVPDGLSIAINAFDPTIQCSNQDSWELLVRTFGRDVQGADLESAGDDALMRFAETMKSYFELSYLPSKEDAESLINQALQQWRG